MKKDNKSKYLQIRVTPMQKRIIKSNAKKMGMTISELILEKALGEIKLKEKFHDYVARLNNSGEKTIAYAEVNDFLTELSGNELENAVNILPENTLSPYERNYLTAMVEQASMMKKIPPPGWVKDIKPLEEPRFGTGLKNLRGHLLINSPLPFRKRNIFIDSAIGERV